MTDLRGRGKSPRSLALIERAHQILAEIRPATVRAVCYRLFVAGVIGSMERKNTSRVSKQLTWARERGIIPWNWIVDETRDVEGVPSWEDPEAFSESISRQYRRDNWSQQDVRIEVLSEKGTMRGTLAPVLQRYGVPFRVMHGFTSATSAYDLAQSILHEGRHLIVFYVGDWDPSGLYMSDVDLPSRLAAYGAAPDEFIRLALTMSDVGDPALPSFHADDKRKDPRYRWFVQQYGRRCWELDALSPVVLRDRLEDAIRAEISWDAWRRCELAEQAETTSLREVLGACRKRSTREGYFGTSLEMRGRGRGLSRVGNRPSGRGARGDGGDRQMTIARKARAATPALRATSKQPGGVTGKGFLPGQSGNPGGRSPGEKTLLRRMYGEDGERVYARLEHLRTLSRTPAKLKAQIDFFLIERLHGRAQQHVEVEGGARLVELLAAARAADGGIR